MSKGYWSKKRTRQDLSHESRVSEPEQLNRVILVKALQVYASNRTLNFKAVKGDFEITPRVAKELMNASGKWPPSRPNRGQHEDGG